MSQILDGLFLGGIRDAQSMTDCAVVVNCTRDINFYATDAVEIRLAVSDNGNPDEKDILYNLIKDDEVFKTIRRALKKKKKVLIHCRAGQQRSAATLACFLIFMLKIGELKFRIRDVTELIKQRRPKAFLNGVHFVRVIREYLYFNRNEIRSVGSRIPG